MSENDADSDDAALDRGGADLGYRRSVNGVTTMATVAVNMAIDIQVDKAVEMRMAIGAVTEAEFDIQVPVTSQC